MCAGGCAQALWDEFSFRRKKKRAGRRTSTGDSSREWRKEKVLAIARLGAGVGGFYLSASLGGDLVSGRGGGRSSAGDSREVEDGDSWPDAQPTVARSFPSFANGGSLFGARQWNQSSGGVERGKVWAFVRTYVARNLGASGKPGADVEPRGGVAEGGGVAGLVSRDSCRRRWMRIS